LLHIALRSLTSKLALSLLLDFLVHLTHVRNLILTVSPTEATRRRYSIMMILSV